MFERVQQYIMSGMTLHVWNALIIFITVMVIGFFIKYILQTAGRRIILRTNTELDDAVLTIVLPRLKWLAIVIGFYLAIEELVKGLVSTNKTSLQMILYAEGTMYIAFIIVLTLLITRIATTAMKFFIRRHAQQTSSAISDAVTPLFNRLATILIFFIAIVIGLEHFGVNASSLLVFLGGGSVAIALAAQETLANMIAGFVIMIDRPFRPGDRIKLPSGEIGDVYEIGIRSTAILDFDNNLIVSPNSDLTKAKVINYSYPYPEVRVLVEFLVGYGTDIDQARKIMLQFAHENEWVLPSPQPEVFLSSAGESSCSLQLIARTDDWKKKFKAETSLREYIYKAFLREGITPGYPQRVIHLSSPLPHDTAKNNKD